MISDLMGRRPTQPRRTLPRTRLAALAPLGSAASWMLLALAMGSASHAAETTPVETISVVLNKSTIINLPAPVDRASVGNPEIADLLVVGQREIYLLGKALGSTNVTVWDKSGRLIRALDVEVVHDLDGLKRKLHQLLPGQPINVFSAQRDLVISGQVSSSPKLDAAVAVAGSYIPRDKEGKPIGVVHNVAQVGGSQQVMLEVKVAEISRTLSRRLGFDFNAFFPGSAFQIGSVAGGASFPQAVLDVPRFDPVTGALESFVQRRVPVFAEGAIRGPFINEFSPAELSIENKGVFLSFLNENYIFNLVIDAAKDRGLAKVLAEPTLTAVSGQEAKFIAGGEFPIPVAQDLGSITIVFKEFGVGVRFLPLVLDSELINLQVNVDVSELSNVAAAIIDVPTSTQTFVIPSLTKRAATTSVEIRSGQTIGIAGLISQSVRGDIEKFPGLGDLPILGALFRSQAFLKEETELVIFVTPRLAKSVDPSTIRLPTDAFVEPSDSEFYLMGQLEGERRTTDDGSPQRLGGTEGRFGHVQ